VSLHATICRYDSITGPIDAVVDSGRQLAAVLGQEPGFVSFAVLDAGHGVIVSINVFEDRTELVAADQIVAEWVAQYLVALLPRPPEVIGGEVIVQRGM
jgi:hypothetical protein